MVVVVVAAVVVVVAAVVVVAEVGEERGKAVAIRVMAMLITAMLAMAGPGGAQGERAARADQAEGGGGGGPRLARAAQERVRGPPRGSEVGRRTSADAAAPPAPHGSTRGSTRTCLTLWP